MRFRNTWGRLRHDLKDQSQSGYDLALADFGVQAGLSEQQIVDLLIHHRAIHGQKQRMRVEYYQRTIAKAWNRSGLDGRPAAGELAPDNAKTAPQAPAAEPATDKPLTVTEKAQLCAKLSAALGVRIVRMVKIAGKDPTYHMELEQGGRIEFPSVKALFSQETAKLLIAATINRRIRKFKQKQWDEIVDDLLLACIEVEADEENSLEGASRLRVATYLNDTAFIDNLEGKAGQEARRPMIVNGRITICSGDLQQHASKTSGTSITVRQIASELGAIGATRTRVVGWPSKREQLRWVLPLSEFDPSEFMKGEPANAADE